MGAYHISDGRGFLLTITPMEDGSMTIDTSGVWRGGQAVIEELLGVLKANSHLEDAQLLSELVWNRKVEITSGRDADGCRFVRVHAKSPDGVPVTHAHRMGEGDSLTSGLFLAVSLVLNKLPPANE